MIENFASFPKQEIMITEEEIVRNWSETTFHICKDKFIAKDKNYHKVRDHCHYIENYHGAAYSKCNLC